MLGASPTQRQTRPVRKGISSGGHIECSSTLTNDKAYELHQKKKKKEVTDLVLLPLIKTKGSKEKKKTYSGKLPDQEVSLEETMTQTIRLEVAEVVVAQEESDLRVDHLATRTCSS